MGISNDFLLFMVKYLYIWMRKKFKIKIINFTLKIKIKYVDLYEKKIVRSELFLNYIFI